MYNNSKINVLVDSYLDKLEKGLQINEATAGENIAALVLFNPLLWVAWRAISAAVDKCTKNCGTFTISNKRDVCIWECRYNEAVKKIELIKRSISQCSKNKKPERCRRMGQEYLDVWKAKLLKAKEKLKIAKRVAVSK